MARSDRRREGGAALVIAMLFLVFLAVLGTAALDTAMLDRQVAGFQNQRRVAFQAAQAGIELTRANLSTGAALVIQDTLLGDTTLYPHGQPAFGPDPTATTPVEDLGATATQGMNLRIGGGGPTFQIKYYKIRVEGRAPAGATSRVEAAVGVLTGS